MVTGFAWVNRYLTLGTLWVMYCLLGSSEAFWGGAAVGAGDDGLGVSSS